MPSSWSAEAKDNVYMLLSLLRAFALVEKVLWHQQERRPWGGHHLVWHLRLPRL